MNAKRISLGTVTILAILALVIPTAVFAGEPPLVGTFHYQWVTYDNGMGGLWATDYFDSSVSIWDLGDDYYRVVFTDGGTFETLDANSPGGGGHVAAGITGTISGGASIIVAGTLDEVIPSNIGPVDYRGGGGWSNYLTPFFNDFQIVEWEDWGWVYASCGNGTWVDNEETEAAYAEEGPNDLMGDVIGDPVGCPTHAQEPTVRNLWAFVNEEAEVGAANICYILSDGQPALDNPEHRSDVRGLCFTESAPNWWQGAVVLTMGDVFENGTDMGYWEGDATAQAFSSAPRLPLHAEGSNNDLVDKAQMFPWTQ